MKLGGQSGPVESKSRWPWANGPVLMTSLCIVHKVQKKIGLEEEQAAAARRVKEKEEREKEESEEQRR